MNTQMQSARQHRQSVIQITGPSPRLNVQVRTPGSKNSSMPILVAAALAGRNTNVRRVPDLADIRALLSILEKQGVVLHRSGDHVSFSSAAISSIEVPTGLSSRLRGSVYALALPVVYLGRGRISNVGGDSLAGRSLEPHLRALRGFRLEARLTGGGLEVSGGPARASEFHLNERVAGVSATCLALLIGASLERTTVIHDVSVEPEVDDLIDCLNAFGVMTHRDRRSIIVRGPFNGTNCSYTVPIDATYCGTLAMASAMTGGIASINFEAAERMGAIIPVLSAVGLTADSKSGCLTLSGDLAVPVDVETGDFPAFPSDLVPPLMALLTKVPGRSTIVERVYEERFDHVRGLVEMGAHCTVEHNEAHVVGGRSLSGCRLQGAGIRETAALLLAALTARGTTTISNAGALARGYENLPGDLAKEGARVATVG